MKTNTILSFVRNSYTALFLAILMMFYAASCQTFGLVNVTPEKMMQIKNKADFPKRFIVHAGSNLYELKNLELVSEQFTGTLEIAQGPVYYDLGQKKTYKDGEKSIFKEVHIILTPNFSNLALGETKLPLKDIAEIRVIRESTGGVVVFAILGLTALMVMFGVGNSSSHASTPQPSTTSSCPFVYVNDAERYVFQGEVFGGAIGANLCRDDYMPLPHAENK